MIAQSEGKARRDRSPAHRVHYRAIVPAPLLIAMSLISIHTADDCSTIFGDASSRAEHRAHRREALKFIDVSSYLISIVHTADWSEPKIISFAGVELIGTEVDAGPARAFVEVDPELGGFGCEPGVYVLRVDDELGADSSVLAILESAVLIEHQNVLRFIPTPSVQPPSFSMVWESTFSMNPYLRRPATALKVAPKSKR
jgi:hypothetical protein